MRPAVLALQPLRAFISASDRGRSARSFSLSRPAAVRRAPPAVARAAGITGGAAVPAGGDSEDWRSCDIYPSPAWGWSKPAPKASLVEFGMAGTASPAILNLVQLVHWIPFLFAIPLANYIFANSATIIKITGITSTQVFCLLLGPLLQVFGSVMGITMHEYEGWQVSEFKSPTDLDDAGNTMNGNGVNIYTNNNEWLRIVAYKFLFMFQAAGLVAFNLGALGFSKWNVSLGLAALASAFFGPGQYKTTINVPWRWDTASKQWKWFEAGKWPISKWKGPPTFPLAWTVAVPFFLFSAINLYAYGWFFNKWTSVGYWGVVAPLLFAIGGIVEGVIAETLFDQRWHGFAVVLLNAGLLAEVWLFAKLCGGL